MENSKVNLLPESNKSDSSQTSIILLKCQADVDEAIKDNKFCTARFVTLSFDAVYRCDQIGQEHLPVWKYFSHSEMMGALNEREWFLNEFWIPFFKQLPVYNKYATVMVFPYIYFIDEALVSLLAITKILSTEKPLKIYNYSGRKNIPCTESIWAFSVFDVTVEHICKIHNIEYINIERQFESIPKNHTAPFLPYFKYVCNYFIGAALVPFILINRTLARRLLKRKVAVSLVSEKEENDRHRQLFDHLVQNEKIRIYNLWDRMGLFFNVWCDGLPAKFFEKKRTVRRYEKLWRKFVEYKKQKTDYPDILQNRLLEFQWSYLFRQMVDTIFNSERRTGRLCKILKPDLMITSQPHQPRSISFSVAFHTHGVNTLVVPHATVPYPQKLYYEEYDKLVTGGNFQAALFKKMGFDYGRLYLTDDYRYEQAIMKVKDGGGISNSRKKIRNKYNLTRDFVITVFTRNLQKGTGLFPKDDVTLSMEKSYSFLKSCKDIARFMPDCSVIFKSHPLRDYFNLYDAFSAAPGVCHLRHEKAELILEASNMAIFVGPLTDVLFSASVTGKPILFCDCGHDRFLLEWLGKHVKIVSEPDHLISAVQWMLGTKKSAINKSDSVIEDFLRGRSSLGRV
jgi:hypothetical protein